MKKNTLAKLQIPIEDLRQREARTILDEITVIMDSIAVPVNLSKAIEVISGCRGKIITCGIGKAGIAMQKFSSTLSSLGSPSCFIHPTEAQHGDLGLIQNKDVLFVCSVSGKTREVCEIIDLARNINVSYVIGLTSHPDSSIRKKVDLVLDMGIVPEVGHLRIAPTSSILVILAITDCLALIVAKEKGLTKEQYSKYHHSGYLGAIARGNKEIY